MEQNRMIVPRIRTEPHGTRTEHMEKKEQEQNDLAEGTNSRMEQNDFKKVGKCPALSMVYLP